MQSHKEKKRGIFMIVILVIFVFIVIPLIALGVYYDQKENTIEKQQEEEQKLKEQEHEQAIRRRNLNHKIAREIRVNMARNYIQTAERFKEEYPQGRWFSSSDEILDEYINNPLFRIARTEKGYFVFIDEGDC